MPETKFEILPKCASDKCDDCPGEVNRPAEGPLACPEDHDAPYVMVVCSCPHHDLLSHSGQGLLLYQDSEHPCGCVA